MVIPDAAKRYSAAGGQAHAVCRRTLEPKEGWRSHTFRNKKIEKRLASLTEKLSSLSAVIKTTVA